MLPASRRTASAGDDCRHSEYRRRRGSSERRGIPSHPSLCRSVTRSACPFGNPSTVHDVEHRQHVAGLPDVRIDMARACAASMRTGRDSACRRRRAHAAACAGTNASTKTRRGRSESGPSAVHRGRPGRHRILACRRRLRALTSSRGSRIVSAPTSRRIASDSHTATTSNAPLAATASHSGDNRSLRRRPGQQSQQGQPDQVRQGRRAPVVGDPFEQGHARQISTGPPSTTASAMPSAWRGCASTTSSDTAQAMTPATMTACAYVYADRASRPGVGRVLSAWSRAMRRCRNRSTTSGSCPARRW